MKTQEPFSEQIEDWLRSDRRKTLGDLGDVFEEKSFAVAIVLLMFLPALPLPTGGVTHVFEAITVLLAGEMVIGLRTIWVPARWRDRELRADAFLSFALDAAGKVSEATMRAVSPATDFSFDFQDLRLRPVREAPGR